MCDLCTPRHGIAEDARSTTPEDAAAYEQWASERDEIRASRFEQMSEALEDEA